MLEGLAAVAETGVPHLSQRLNFLFAHIPKAGEQGGYYSNEQAAAALRSNGVSATGAYLSQLRAGTRTNPSALILNGLATLFGVEIGYFFNDDIAREVQEQIATLEAMSDERMRNVMARAAGVDEEGLTEAFNEALARVRDGKHAPRDGAAD